MIRILPTSILAFITVVGFLQACGDSSNSGTGGDAGPPHGGDGAIADDDGTPIHGKVVVHVPGAGEVSLGDGSRFKATAATESGYVVRFEDPAIEGPQTVTWVQTPPANTVGQQTYIIAGTNRTDVWFRGATDKPSAPSKPEHLAQVHGKVDGAPAANGMSVAVASLAPTSGHVEARGQDQPERTFSLDVSGPPGTKSAPLVAVSLGKSPAYAGTAYRFGMMADAPISDATPVNLTLDTPFDQPFTVTLPSVVGKTARTTVYLRWWNNEVVQTFAKTTDSTITLGALPARAPFDQRDLTVVSSYGHVSSSVIGPVPASVMNVDAPFVPPSALTEPTAIPDDRQSGASGPDVTVDPNAFRLAWDLGDDSAKIIHLYVSCDIDNAGHSWDVQTDAHAKSFTFPSKALCGTADTWITLATKHVEDDAQAGETLGAPARGATATVRTTTAHYRFHAVVAGTTAR